MAENSTHKFLSKRDVLLNKADAFALEADQLAYQGKYEEAVDKSAQALSISPLYPTFGHLRSFSLR